MKDYETLRKETERTRAYRWYSTILSFFMYLAFLLGMTRLIDHPDMTTAGITSGIVAVALLLREYFKNLSKELEGKHAFKEALLMSIFSTAVLFIIMTFIVMRFSLHATS